MARYMNPIVGLFLTWTQVIAPLNSLVCITLIVYGIVFFQKLARCSSRLLHLVCFLLPQLSDLTLSHLQRIPETFRRRPCQPAKSSSEMTLAGKAGP
jgi:hypothetical protein